MMEAMMEFPKSLSGGLTLSTVIFLIGMAGFLLRRNMLISLMCIELMMNAANLALVTYNRFNPATDMGQVMVIFTIVIAAAEAAVGLAIVVNLFKFYGEVRTDRASELSG
jgi:NADH-quinone oxidoreductase subunit K